MDTTLLKDSDIPSVKSLFVLHVFMFSFEIGYNILVHSDPFTSQHFLSFLGMVILLVLQPDRRGVTIQHILWLRHFQQCHEHL